MAQPRAWRVSIPEAKTLSCGTTKTALYSTRHHPRHVLCKQRVGTARPILRRAASAGLELGRELERGGAPVGRGLPWPAVCLDGQTRSNRISLRSAWRRLEDSEALRRGSKAALRGPRRPTPHRAALRKHASASSRRSPALPLGQDDKVDQAARTSVAVDSSMPSSLAKARVCSTCTEPAGLR
jgi:hypothetical protein